MKKVISYSLFWLGKDSHSLLYSNGLKAICRAHHTLLPDWEWRIYHDGTLHKDETARHLFAYEEAGFVTLVNMGQESQLCRAMIWRMRPIWDASVSHTLCRDLDSLPTPRDAMAAKQFVDSNAALHSMCDNPQHGAPIMGGLCGFKNSLFSNLTGLHTFDDLVAGEPLETHGDDQLLLLKKVWPVLQNHLCEHCLSGRTPSADAMKSYTTIEGVDLPGVPDTVLSGGDSLIPYMGVAGFDPAKAEAFYNEHGDPALMNRISELEASA